MADRSPDYARDRFLVTGGAGFLGTPLCAQLRARGVGDDRLCIPRSRDVDLTQQEAVRRLFADVQPDVVIHLAAEVGGIGANRANPGRYFYANLAMGMHLLEQARVAGIRKFVQVGTICAYPKFAEVPFREDDLWNGYPEETNAPYGIAKKALLTMCQAYRAQYDMHAIYLLPVNLYGPGDNFDLETSHVIPALIRKCVEARRGRLGTVTCWGDGSASREFLYVEDAARGILMATERYDAPEPVNLGTGVEITIRDLAEKIADCTGFTGRYEWDTSQPNGQPRRCLDTRRARERFGFTADTDLDTGLKRTVDWFINSYQA